MAIRDVLKKWPSGALVAPGDADEAQRIFAACDKAAQLHHMVK